MEKAEKKKERKFQNSYIYGFIFIIFSIIFEVLSFMRLNLGILPTYFAIEFCIILILAGIIFIIPTEPLKIILMSIFLGVQFILNIVNTCLYKTIYDLVTVDMIFTISSEGANAFEFNQLDWTYIIISLFVIALLIVTIIFANTFMPKFKLKTKKVAGLVLTMLAIIFEIFSVSAFTAIKHYNFKTDNPENLIQNNAYLYSSLDVKYASLKKFGFWSFYINNTSQFFGNKSLNKKEMETLTQYVKEGENFTYSNSTYNGKDVSGLLKNDNLILIMMESAEWFAIDPYNTEDLYTFVEESVKFSEFHGKNKTNISEQISLIGNTTNTTSLKTLNSNDKLNVPNSLPNLFKKKGYESVNFFHDYIGDFYFRNSINTTLGFDDVYSIEDYQERKEFNSSGFGDFIDDGVFIKEFLNEFIPTDKKFFSYYTTVTTHGPYGNSVERYKQYYERFDNSYDDFCKYVEDNNLNYNLPEKGTKEYILLKNYKARAMALDNTIKVIKTYLETTRNTNGDLLCNNTSIVLFSDHNAYYSDLCFKMKNIGKTECNQEIENIPFVIFNKKLTAGDVNTFCNTYDIFPTICDLYGLPFNNNLTQGYSVFSDDIQNSLFVSSKSGIFDGDFYTVTLDKIYAKDNTIETNSNLQKFKDNTNKFLQKQQFIEDYYNSNYENYILANQ